MCLTNLKLLGWQPRLCALYTWGSLTCLYPLLIPCSSLAELTTNPRTCLAFAYSYDVSLVLYPLSILCLNGWYPTQSPIFSGHLRQWCIGAGQYTSFQILIQWLHISSLKSAMEVTFTPQKWATTTNQVSSPHPRCTIIKYLLVHYCQERKSLSPYGKDAQAMGQISTAACFCI